MPTAFQMNNSKHEMDSAYINFNRVLKTGQSVEAAKLALKLADVDSTALWNYLKLFTSTETNYKETTPLLVVKALHDSWLDDQQDAYIVHAVLTLSEGPKMSSARDFGVKHNLISL